MFYRKVSTQRCKWSNRVHTVRGFKLVCFAVWQKVLFIRWCLLICTASAPRWVDSPVCTISIACSLTVREN